MSGESHPYRYAAERIVRGFGLIPDSPDFSENRELAEIVAKSAACSTKLDSCVTLYDGLCEVTGRTLPWGIFTGVHPIRFIRENREVITHFRISPQKLTLADKIIAVQDSVLFPKSGNCRESRKFHLYIGIPFCSSRCKYCSFVSETVGKSLKLIPQYFDFLLRELEIVGQIVKNRRLSLDTVYIGGGTPTAVPTCELSRLLSKLPDFFDMSEVREFTVEAGRPETLTPDMLSIIKESGANRISINPQSMNADTLDKCGRRHSPEDVYTAYKNATNFDFGIINMDLIAGLPNENRSDFEESVNKVADMSPTNITVHGLAGKRAAFLDKSDLPEFENDFTDLALKLLEKRGYFPYYLYRQSNCVGDSIGYTKSQNGIGLYNVFMTDESVTVVGAGCGAASRTFVGDKTLKHYNHKYPYEYISRFGELMNKKREFVLGGVNGN